MEKQDYLELDRAWIEAALQPFKQKKEVLEQARAEKSAKETKVKKALKAGGEI
mgnify:FL=1